MADRLKTAFHRITSKKLPPLEEIEAFGGDGEEAVYRILRQHFDCVIRNLVVPHKELFLEKDFLVIHKGVPFVLEVKNWKGVIGMDGDQFYQNKDNGVRKTLKSPVGTTQQFLRRMKEFYALERRIYGMVVFAEPDCTLQLPTESQGIALLPVEKMVAYIRSKAKEEGRDAIPVEGDTFLRCTRFYSDDSEFCKGVLADCEIPCYTEDHRTALLDTTRIAYLSVEPQPLRLRDKLYVTFCNGSSGVFYNRDALLTVKLLDGSFEKIALNRVRHIVF
ncbi:MAG: NERD domain-containing protein [Clostridia bacterium]|nr:NERD domain-containing protein [Clostridia bacterium]